MIISVALPMVALRMPPTAGPEYAARTPVDSPKTLASGAMARAEAIKISRGEACKRSSTMAAGTNRRSKFSHRCPVLRGNLLHSARGCAGLFFAGSGGAGLDGARLDTWGL